MRKGVNVLVMMSGERFRDELARLVAGPERHALIASGNDEAMHLLTEKEVDVALVGLEENWRDALPLLGRMKRAQPRTEIIVLASHKSVRLGIELMKLGIFGDLAPPYDLKTLNSMIDKAVTRPKGHGAVGRGLFQRLEDALAAVALAEEGEANAALEIDQGRLHRKKD